MENLEKRIQTEIMSAMKEKNEIKLGALRSVKTAIQNEKTNGTFHELTDADVLKIIQKQVKQRTEAEEIYRQANRNELADKEMNERITLEEYLPKQLTNGQIVDIVKSIAEEVNATTIKDMGKIMGVLNKKYSGQFDGKTASIIVREFLN